MEPLDSLAVYLTDHSEKSRYLVPVKWLFVLLFLQIVAMWYVSLRGYANREQMRS